VIDAGGVGATKRMRTRLCVVQGLPAKQRRARRVGSTPTTHVAAVLVPCTFVPQEHTQEGRRFGLRSSREACLLEVLFSGMIAAVSRMLCDNRVARELLSTGAKFEASKRYERSGTKHKACKKCFSVVLWKKYTFIVAQCEYENQKVCSYSEHNKMRGDAARVGGLVCVG
jgi:hypothetical protein